MRTRRCTQCCTIGREQREQRDWIGAGPFALFPRLIPAHRTASDEAQQRPPIMDPDNCREARRPAAEHPGGAIRQGRGYRASCQAAIDPVENAMTAARQGARQPLGTDADPLPPFDELSSPARHLRVHANFMDQSPQRGKLMTSLAQMPPMPARGPRGVRSGAADSCAGAAVRDHGFHQRAIQPVPAPSGGYSPPHRIFLTG